MGCLSMFGKTWWKITKGALVITKGDMIDMLYLCCHNTDYFLSIASTETCATPWHHRIGHMSEKGMQILLSRKLLLDMKQVSFKFSEEFVFGK